MTQFTTRIELHDADWNDYVNLHIAMAAQGFVNTVTADDGKVYELPPAEYNFSGNFTRSQVLDRAKAAASKTQKKFAAFVTESAGRTWVGLAVA